MNSAGDLCYECSDIDVECLTCSDEFTCTQCQDNYALLNGICSPVSVGTTGIMRS